MNKIKINFHIKALDSEQHFVVLGEHKNNSILFVDPEKNTNRVLLNKNLIEYSKSGNIEMNFKFSTEKPTNGYYIVSSVRMDFEINTLKIIHKPDSVEIKYELYNNEEVVNEVTLKMKYSTV